MGACCYLQSPYRFLAVCFLDWRRRCAAPARNLEQTLRSGARGLAGGARRLHRGFVISEIALAVVLLVAAGMLGRTLLREDVAPSGCRYS